MPTSFLTKVQRMALTWLMTTRQSSRLCQNTLIFFPEAGAFHTTPLTDGESACLMRLLGIIIRFLCALPTSQRAQWAARYRELLKPGGKLITLIYPIGQQTSLSFLPRHVTCLTPLTLFLFTDGDRPGGPPYSLDPEEVCELLTKTGFK